MQFIRKNLSVCNLFEGSGEALIGSPQAAYSVDGQARKFLAMAFT
jgi:hypothetical protein